MPFCQLSCKLKKKKLQLYYSSDKFQYANLHKKKQITLKFYRKIKTILLRTTFVEKI